MTIRVGLMGFGRIGRNVFRILHDREDVQVTAVSDIADHEGLVYLLKYDTIMGRFPTEVSLKGDTLYTYGRPIKMVSGREPGDVNWKELGVDVVVEATARYRGRAELERHLEAGAKRVILCVPPTEEPDFTCVMGVNHHRLRSEHRIISNASTTVHCAAPIVQIIDQAFGVERLFFTTVHAYTNDQRLADVPTDDLRRGRAASENIIPTATTAGLWLERLMPQLEGKVTGLALGVPVPDGSLVDMTLFTRDEVDVTAINEVVRTAADSKYRRYVEYVDDPIVSSDVTRTSYSSTFDAQATQVLRGHLVKSIAWYDNGWGYSHRVVDLIRYLGELDGGHA